MRTERLLPLAVTLAAVLAGCNTARSTGETSGNCTSCHGGADNQTGAPPLDLAGNLTGDAVGAHTQHLEAGVTCDTCHVVPATASAPGHIDGDNRAEVVLGGKATLNGASPTYVPIASPGRGGTCNGTYCHAPRDANGVLLNAGGLNPNPAWTDTGALCQQCHGFPPPGSHPQNPDCSACHPTSVNDDETFKVGGTHLNGTVDVGSIHPANWVLPAGELQPHGLAANHHDPSWPNGLEDCKGCHGADLTGGSSGISCSNCHTWPPVVSGTATVDCTFCHGNAQRTTAVELNKAAPPVDTQGRVASTDRGVGAHQAHLEVQALSTNVACGSCHPGQPYTDIAHLNGQVALALLVPGTATVAGTFDTAAGTCASTYCHGNFRAGATANTPAWTAPGSQSACGTCHKPQSGPTVAGYSDAHDFHVRVQTFGCSACHDSQVTSSTVNRTLHANGTKDVIAAPNYNTVTHTCSASCHNGSFAASPSPPWY